MTLEEIVKELEKLEVYFALVTCDLTGTAPQVFQLHRSADRDGLPQHPAYAAGLMCEGIQLALNDAVNGCTNSGPAFDISKAVLKVNQSLEKWLQADMAG